MPTIAHAKMSADLKSEGSGSAVYCLQDELIEYGDDDDYRYEEVDVEDPLSSDEEENFEVAMRLVKEQGTTRVEGRDKSGSAPHSKLTEWPEVVEDFVRNYLLRMGMLTTLDCFQVEWYRMKECGLLKEGESQSLPDVYHQNRQLIKRIELLLDEADRFKMAARQAKDRFVRLKKERDYHRMNHRRVLQEKERLVRDLRQLQEHLGQREDALVKMKTKYEGTLRKKTLLEIESKKRRPVQPGTSVSKAIIPAPTHTGLEPPSNQELAAEQDGCVKSQQVRPAKEAPLQPPPASGDGGGQLTATEVTADTKVPKLPVDLANPYEALSAPQCGHLTKEGGFSKAREMPAHEYAVTGLCLHPRKAAFVTGSDDHQWRMWSLHKGEILMSGCGHKDWVGGVDISPDGSVLASASGDGSAKLWRFTEGKCVATLMDHQQPVWDCSWHSGGDFLATSSLDHTVKVWDATRGVCRLTLRGHADSVNSVQFLAYSNLLSTCSADKTVSLWDARSGLCVQTYFGHTHSCNSTSPTLKGDMLASCDCFGHLFLWDIRGNKSLLVQDLGPHSLNSVQFDPSGEVVAMASDDGSVKLMNIVSGQVDELKGHVDRVQVVAFAQDGSFLMSAGTDGRVLTWQ